mmetsp:Transcript_47430/g.76087  ORF Transcript_47430/g.76087 Transcript_47430/m.76087 type:complete len:259 (-) Transcript_47430:42-818(-)
MGCANSAPSNGNDSAAMARVEELQLENNKLKKDLKEIQKKLSKYELNAQTDTQLNIIVAESRDDAPPTPLPEGETLIGREDNAEDNNLESVLHEHQDQQLQKQDESASEESEETEEAPLDPPEPKPLPPKKEETDVFWIDVKQKVQEMDYEYIKKCIPHKDFIDEEDEQWRLQLWKTDYGEYELQCLVRLVSYNTGKWTDDDENKLFVGVQKYGLNSKAAWERTAESLNREVDDVMAKYSQLLQIPVTKLKKMSTARG